MIRAIVGLMLGASLVACVCAVAADEPAPKKLTPEERKALAGEWKGLNDSAVKQYETGRFVEAEKSFRTALGLARRLYPAAEYPASHQDLATNLFNLARTLEDLGRYGDAEPFYREAVDAHERLYKEGHENTASSLDHLGHALQHTGKVADAEKAYRKALEMERRLFKADNDLTAATLCDLAGILEERGKLAEAEPLQQEATAMYRRLAAADKSPDAQIALAITVHSEGLLRAKQGKFADAEPLLREALEISQRVIKEENPITTGFLNSLATLLHRQGKLKEAEPLFRNALAVQKRLYRGDNFGTSVCMNNLASLLRDLERYDEAEPLYRGALEMRQRLFKGDHPRTALSMNNLALVLTEQGKYAEAEPLYGGALKMQRRLFKGPHPDTILTLSNLANFCHRRGKYEEADPLSREALEMSRALVGAYAAEKSEGEALTLLVTIPTSQNVFLSGARLRRADPAAAYREVWADKGAVARVFEQRQLAARAAADPKAVAIWADLSAARRRRADLLLAAAPADPRARKQRDDDLKELADTIARLDRDLRPLLPAVDRAEKLARATPADLQKVLPADSVVVDFLGYSLLEQDPEKAGRAGEKWTNSYLAFVIAKNKLTWVDLGPAKPLEDAVAAWREAIRLGKDIPPAVPARVRELAWAKVRKEVPDGVKVVYVSPDLALCRVPWAALPGDRANTILLEDYAVAVVPHAAFLLDKLWPADPLPKPPTEALAVGDVDYRAEVAPPAQLALDRGEPVLRPGQKAAWPALAATAAEAKGVAALAAKKKLDARTLAGDKGSVAAVLAALPKARYAHLATHGFFADPEFRSAFQIDPEVFKTTRQGERVGEAARSPLVMTGLVLAGANRADTPGRGILTGEALVDVDLSGLRLAVLSACETGLGDVAGGEGTFGLQRAFHLAGARDVVASLWKVPDQPTAALMALFYRNLWEKDLPPVEALRQAQLEVYRNPGKVAELAEGFRGKFVEVPGSTEDAAKPGSDGKAHPRQWAAFTLSGPGR
jgi:CHAT domain-containing protein/tetratricopeptide (TPR) repeat protein